MTTIVRLMVLLLVVKTAKSYEFYSIAENYIPLITDVAEFQRTKSVFFLYAQTIKAMEMTTMVFKWTRAFSREGFLTLNLYFSELHESALYVKSIVRPLFVAVITDYTAINEFSVASSNYDMSFPVWLVIFVYVGQDSDYCHDPPGNIFHVRFDTRMMVRCTEENILREWYAINEESIEIDEVATWSLEKGMTMLAPSILYERRFDLQGLVFKTVIVKDAPFAFLDEHGDLDGIFGKISKELRMTLNFSLEIVSEVDEYGILDPKNGVWSGAMGELSSGRADISFSDFSMTSTRLTAVDFVIPLLFSKSSIYIKEPETIAVKWNSYFLAFSPSLWFAILGVILAATILLTFLKMRRRTDRNIKDSLHDSFFEVWGIFCQQGITNFPDRSSLRIAYLSLSFSAIVILDAYSAAFISFLTSDIRILPFHSLEEFAQDGNYRFAVFRGTADYDIFANSKDQIAKKLMTLMLEENDLPLSLIEGFERLCKNRKLAIYTSEEIKKSINFAIPCKVATIHTGGIDSLSMILSKNNPFTGLINYNLQKFVNNGMIHRLKDANFKNKLDRSVKHHQVTIISVVTLFSFIEIGIILGIFILIIEKCVFTCKRSNKSHDDRIPSNRKIAIVCKKGKPINILREHESQINKREILMTWMKRER